MTALTDALAACIQIHENQGALADPVAMAYSAEIAFKKAVVDAIDEMLTNTAMVGSSQNTASAAQIESLQSQVAADQAAAAKIEAVIADAAPSSTEPVPLGNTPAVTGAAPVAELPPTIAPTTGA